MASMGDLSGFRETDAGARSFESRYYNEDVHKAAFATPEFMKRRLAGL